MKELTKEEFGLFHNELVQMVADFLKDKELPDNAWMFSLSVDDLKSLQEYGKWTPANDSYMGITDGHGKELIWEM